MRRVLLPIALSIALLPAAHASDLELSLSDDTAELMFTVPTENFGLQDGRVGAGVLFNDDDDYIGQLSLESIGRVSQSLSFNVGIKGYAGQLDDPDDDVTAIGIGGGIRVGLATQIPLAVLVNGFLAPDILSFGDAEGLKEFEARLEAGFARNAAAFIGYNLFEVEVENRRRDVEVQDGVNVGVRLSF